MKIATFRKSLGLIGLLITFTVSAWAQSFPPALITPFENAQGASFARSPSIATDPSGVYPYLYMVYGSTTSNDYLYLGTSTDGVNFNGPAVTTLDTAYSPAIAFYDSYLWVAWVSDGGGGLTKGALYLDYTNDPSSGFSASPILVTETGSAYYPVSSPTLAAYGSQLWIASVDSSDNIVTFATTGTGGSFSEPSPCIGTNDPDGYVPQETAQVGMVEFPYNNLMYYAYQTSENTIRVCSTNGTPSSQSYSSEGGYSTGSGVSATVFGSYLTLAFKDNTGSNHVYVEGTNDGSSWTGTEYGFSMNGNNEITPSGAEWDDDYYMIFTGNASNHRMWTTYGN